MELKPSQPPGHGNRKLRGLVSEIERLIGEGYTFRAIQEVLAANGVNVGLSTIHREVARLGRGAVGGAIRPRSPDVQTPPLPPPAPPAPIAKPEGAPPPARPTMTDAELDEFFNKPPPNRLFNRVKTI